MSRLKVLFQSFCITTTGALFGMIVSLEIIDHEARLRLVDIWGLMLACFLIMLWCEVVYYYLEKVHMGRWLRAFLHYIGTTFILIAVGRKLEWLGLEKNENIGTFLVSITCIYLMVYIVNKCYDYQISKNINEALQRYRKNKKDDET